MRYIFALAIVALGALIVIYSEKIYQALGPVPWAEQHLGVEGGSRLFYKLAGLTVILLAFLYLSGVLQTWGLAIFGRLFGLPRTM